MAKNDFSVGILSRSTLIDSLANNSDTITIPWGDGTEDVIMVVIDPTIGNQTVRVLSSENKDTRDRSKDLLFKTNNANGKQSIATLHLTQAKAVYTYTLTLSPTLTNIPASGGYSDISATLVTYRNGNQVSSESVNAIYTGTSTGFTISNNRVTASNRGDVVGSERSITVTGKYTTEDDQLITSTVVIKQAANTVTYSTPTISSFVVSDIPAKGGTVSSGTLKYSQTATYSSGNSNNITTGANVTYSEAITASSLGTTVKARTKVGELTANVSLNGKSASKTVSVYQAANAITTYSTPTISISYNDIPAKGGSVTPTISYSQTATYTSGSTSTITSGGTKTYSGSGVNTSTGSVSASSLGTTIKARTKITTVTAKVSLNGKTGTKTVDVYQAANSITSYGDVTINLSYKDIPANGSSISPTISYSQTATYSSGSTKSITTGGTVSYSGTSVNTTNGSVSASNLGTTIKARTKITDSTAKVSLNGKSASKTVSVYQAANAITTYGSVSTPSGKVTDIPASGGTRTNGTASGSSQTITYTSGATRSGSISYTWSGTVTGSDLGTTVKARTKVGELTLTANGEGSKSSSSKIAVYQAANEIESYNYGSYTADLTLNSTSALSAAADSRTVTWGKIRRSKTPVYTSGATGTASTEYWSGTAYLTISVNSGTSYCSLNNTSYTNSSTAKSSTLTKNTYGTTVISSQTYTLNVRKGSTTGDIVKTINITTIANELENNNYNPRITTYGTPTVSIGSGITAAGGSATVTHSVTNTETYNYLYTSGSISSNKTRSKPGTSTISITSNGNNRFSLSGNKLTHTSMGTNITTDTVTIKAVNSGDSTKYSTSSKSVSNSITSYSTPTITKAPTYSKFSAEGGTKTPTTGTYSQTATYTSGSTSTITSGGTISYSMSTYTGFTLNSTSTGSVTAAYRGTTVGEARSATIVYTVTLNGKSASKNITATQEANEKTSITYGTPVINTLSYNDIPAKGGSVTPTVSYSQSRTQNYTSGATAILTSLTSGGTLGWSSTNPVNGGTIDKSNGSVTCNTTGSTVVSRRSILTVSLIVTLNSKSSASKTVSVYQAANSETLSSINLLWDGTSTGSVPAKGGGQYVLPKFIYSYTSGSTKTVNKDNITLNTGVSWCTSDTSSNLTVQSRGTTVGEARTCKISYTSGSVKSNELTLTQAANSLIYGTISFSNIPSTVDFEPGSNQYSVNTSVALAKVTTSYSSGSSGSTLTLSKSEIKATIKTSKNGFSLDSPTNSYYRVAVTNNESESERNGFVITLTASKGGKTATFNQTFNQGAGVKNYTSIDFSVSVDKVNVPWTSGVGISAVGSVVVGSYKWNNEGSIHNENINASFSWSTSNSDVGVLLPTSGKNTTLTMTQHNGSTNRVFTINATYKGVTKSSPSITQQKYTGSMTFSVPSSSQPVVFRDPIGGGIIYTIQPGNNRSIASNFTYKLSTNLEEGEVVGYWYRNYEAENNLYGVPNEIDYISSGAGSSITIGCNIGKISSRVSISPNPVQLTGTNQSPAYMTTTNDDVYIYPYVDDLSPKCSVQNSGLSRSLSVIKCNSTSLYYVGLTNSSYGTTRWSQTIKLRSKDIEGNIIDLGEIVVNHEP